MGIFQNISNGLIDLVKLVLIALVCLVVIFVGGYLLADYVGLIPVATGLYRPLSLQMFLTDMPYIGGNMIYLLVAMALLIVVVLAIELYDRKRSSEGETEAKKGAQDQKVAATAEAPTEKK